MATAFWLCSSIKSCTIGMQQPQHVPTDSVSCSPFMQLTPAASAVLICVSLTSWQIQTYIWSLLFMVVGCHPKSDIKRNRQQLSVFDDYNNNNCSHLQIFFAFGLLCAWLITYDAFMMDWHVLIEQFMDNNHNGIYTNRLLMGKMSLQIRPKMRALTIYN